MDPKHWDVLEPQRSALRSLVSNIEKELAFLDGAGGAASRPELKDAWQALVRALALGPEPELRNCTSCRRAIMASATRCRYCWLKGSASAP